MNVWLKLFLVWPLISIIAALLIAWICGFSLDPFDYIEDHEDNMDDEGGWK